jgi:uncharacterized protein (TIGR03382 family)
MPAGVNFGIVGSGNFNLNNDGRVSFGTVLQGTAVTQNVNVQVSGGFPGVPAVITVPGIQGNQEAIVTGMPNALQVIARTGDPAPGFDGLYHKVVTNNGSLVMNNAGDILFQSDTTPFAAGATIGSVGQLLATVPTGPSVLWGWSQSYGLLPMFYTGQSVEVDPGIFKTVSQFSVHNADNGDGGSSGLNDNGTFVVSLAFTDNSWAYVTAQIPAPSTGAMALLGLGMLGRRRRK